MIEYGFLREKELLSEYAEFLGDTAIQAIIAKGTIASAADARALAKFYWRMVDASLEDDIEDWLERIANTLMGACASAGYRDVWNDEVPED